MTRNPPELMDVPWALLTVHMRRPLSYNLVSPVEDSHVTATARGRGGEE